MLLQIFNEETSGKNYDKGQRILNNDLVSSLDITSIDDVINIDGNVISEKLFNEYHTMIKMETGKVSILSTYCSCLDYEENEAKKRNYACKHLVATFYKAVEELAEHPLLNSKDKEKVNVLKDNSNILSMLLGDERDKDEIRIEVYINKDGWNHSISAEFKMGVNAIGSGNLYVLKDINSFLLAYHDNIPIEYSKSFTFHMKNQRLSTKDRRLIDFIDTLMELEWKNRLINKNRDKLIDGKYIKIPNYLVREFIEVIAKHRVYLNEGFFGRPVETEILMEEPNVDFDLKYIKNSYVLKSPLGMPISLSSKNDVFLFGTAIYLPDYEFCYRISPYLQVFNQAKVITIPGSEEETLLRRLIPELHLLSSKVTLSKPIMDKIVIGDVGFSFYFDRDKKDVVLVVKVKYGAYEFNMFEDIKEKIIYRDSKKEQQVVSTLRSLGFEEAKGRFYLLKEEDYIFRFFKCDIGRLQQIGEVYYSDSFKGIKYIGGKGINGDIKSGKYNYFEMDFKIGDIPQAETSKILKAFRDNHKYYKLKSGEYLDLEELELKQFLKLLALVSADEILDNHVRISKGKGVFIDGYLQENDIRYLGGREELGEISNKLKNIKELRLEKPEGLNASLREYQKVGYNWLKTLDYLGLGGILGDEMGLGKTLQAICFILSNRGSKSLIVAPTSLIYNWTSEFQKFAPSVTVAAVNGSKEDREIIINSIENYDVVITTYNLLKRDLESYKLIEFDYCILDEAQNIKNPNSQNATAVKEINARTRFALTGTPIENSLMELWSIFDFIMPGYLFDEKRFSVRYHKRLNEGPEILEELNKLIKPFVLRRMKRDVILELPDKIEKKLMVALEDEQKKVYGTYVKHVVDIIENRVKQDEFKKSKIEILSYITKLRQLCLDPSVLMNEYAGGSGKMEALVELLQRGIEEGHRILVFSQFTSVLKNIGKRIAKEGITFNYLDGSISSQNRMSLVNAFNEGENSVFLISLKAGGTGLNLTSADIVIHFDPWWNPAVEEQATDRAHRIGQKNVVEVIKIIAKGTIEEKVIALQEEKKKLISELMGDELSSGEGITSFTEEELLGLFESY
ncbi:MAG: helicase [Clostridiales bacterium]|jgi:SNF2 family DNA or RNA helicase/predicted nucleic acid-binding Zn finger protein|nr:helicase [Clostridiales bacterium]